MNISTKQTIQLLHQINMNKYPNVHQIYGAGIQTHNIPKRSHHP